MPDFWTHIIGGEKVLEGLAHRPFQEMVAGYRRLFNFGCQAPDFFFGKEEIISAFPDISFDG